MNMYVIKSYICIRKNRNMKNPEFIFRRKCFYKDENNSYKNRTTITYMLRKQILLAGIGISLKLQAYLY